jgi:hypothetical protein
MVYLWAALGPEINQVYVYLAPTETRPGYIRQGPARLNRKMQLMASRVTMKDFGLSGGGCWGCLGVQPQTFGSGSPEA